MSERSWPTVILNEPLLCSQGGIPYNKTHLDALSRRIDDLLAEIERMRERLKGSDMLAHVRGEQIERLRAALREAAIFLETAAPFLPDDVAVKHSFNNGETLQTRPLSVVLRACAKDARRALEGK